MFHYTAAMIRVSAMIHHRNRKLIIPTMIPSRAVVVDKRNCLAGKFPITVYVQETKDCLSLSKMSVCGGCIAQPTQYVIQFYCMEEGEIAIYTKTPTFGDLYGSTLL